MRNPSMKANSSATPCCSKVGIKRGPWTPEEDEILSNYVKKEGEGRWRTLPKRAGLLRCGKSCRLRWMNYLRPSVKRGRIDPDEEDLILRLHRLLGNRWSLIAGRIPGRTDNEIKNYWNTYLSKKLISQGIDPRTHKPLDPNPSLAPSISHDLNPNYNVISSTRTLNNATIQLEEARETRHIINDHNQGQVDDDDGTKDWPNFDGLLMEFQNGQQNNEDQDGFSTFLDSLINESVFINQNQEQQQHNVVFNAANSSMQQIPIHTSSLYEGSNRGNDAVLEGDQNVVLNSSSIK